MVGQLEVHQHHLVVYVSFSEIPGFFEKVLDILFAQRISYLAHQKA
jgi:hypothetical protein